MRKAKALDYEKQVIGNLGGLLGCEGVRPEKVQEYIQHVLISLILRAESDSQYPLWNSYNRTREKWD